MSRWTPEQRQAAAQKRAEAKAPLLAHAGLVQVFPACAGMSRCMRNHPRSFSGVPRVYGDEPAGKRSPVLIREPVEGVVCERCPECRERGEIP